MGSFLLTVICLSLVGLFNFLSPLVEAQGTANPGERPPPPPPDWPPPPPPSFPPPPPPLLSPPPPPSPSPPPPPSSPPPATKPRSAPPPPSPRPPPPPKRSNHLIPRPPHHPKKDGTQGIARSQSKQTLNLGKKIGLMFVGIAMIMQVCVVAFLIIKKRRLLKSERY